MFGFQPRYERLRNAPKRKAFRRGGPMPRYPRPRFGLNKTKVTRSNRAYLKVIDRTGRSHPVRKRPGDETCGAIVDLS